MQSLVILTIFTLSIGRENMDERIDIRMLQAPAEDVVSIVIQSTDGGPIQNYELIESLREYIDVFERCVEEANKETKSGAV